MSVAIDLAKVNALLTSVVSIVISQELLKGKDISPHFVQCFGFKAQCDTVSKMLKVAEKPGAKEVTYADTVVRFGERTLLFPGPQDPGPTFNSTLARLEPGSLTY